MMSPCRCHLHDPPTFEMPAYLPEIQRRSLPEGHIFIARRLPPAQRRFSVKHCDEILQMPDGPHRDPRHQRCLSFLTCWNDRFIKTAPDRSK